MGGDDLLALAVRRKAALAALATEPHHRRELQETLDASKTTCHRIIRSFREAGLIRQTDGGYTLTELGQAVESKVTDFERGVQTAIDLEPLLTAAEAAAVEIDIDLFSDATITHPTPEDPSPPVERFLELFRDSETIRTIDRTSFAPPLYIEEMLEMSMEHDRTGVAVLPESVIETRFAEYPDLHRRVADADAPIRYRAHDAVPFGLTVFDDDHIGLRAYDDETGAPVVFVDTDDPAAVEWGIETFEHYYEASTPVSAVDSVPDWMPAGEVPF